MKSTATAIDYIITNSVFNNNSKSAMIKIDISDQFSIIFGIKPEENNKIKERKEDHFIFKHTFEGRLQENN